MPYITKEAREEIRAQTGARRVPNTSGELNFRLTAVVLEYLYYQGLTYETINDITGALGEVKAEFRRRIVAPYENQKIIENGDVYPAIGIDSSVGAYLFREGKD